MKRKEPSTPVDAQQRRRQPQTSCDFCRSKKLKCDRQAPCASCVTRALECSSAVAAGALTAILPPTVQPAQDPSILSRLQSLERAVFGRQSEPDTPISIGSAAPVGQKQKQNKTRADVYLTSANHDATSHLSPASNQDSERQQTARFLDSTYANHGQKVSLHNNRLRFRIGTSHLPISSPDVNHTNDATWSKEQCCRPTWMMTRDEALALLQDFVDNPYHLLPIFYEPSTRCSISNFYDELERGRAVDEACAALIFSIAATSASFFNEGTNRQHMFASNEEAAQASMKWTQCALNILGECHSAGSGMLQEVQARAVIAYVVYNTEGCSPRFRFLHGCSISAAREISLHLVDSPAMKGKIGDLATKEIKRRLWWHLASTDWLLSHMNGPLDGTYTVHPRHMNVKYPRNLNDNDLSLSDDTLTFPLNVPTQMTCFLQRIRLAEICRAVADSRDPGFPETDVTDPDKLSVLDRLFEQALSDLPPFLQMDAPMPPGAPLHLALQRSLILICLHIRRALLHRPSLLHRPEDPRHQVYRRECISSAHIVTLIAIPLLDGSSSATNETLYPGGPLFCRLGIIISSMFMACTILALNAGLEVSRSASNQESHPNTETQTQLSRACRALASAGSKSVVAADLVRSLTAVLRRYCIRDIDSVGAFDDSRSVQHREVETMTQEADLEAPRAWTADGTPGLAHDVSFDTEFQLDGLWDEFINAMPNTEGFDDLFAGLDSLTGTT